MMNPGPTRRRSWISVVVSVAVLISPKGPSFSRASSLVTAAAERRVMRKVPEKSWSGIYPDRVQKYRRLTIGANLLRAHGTTLDENTTTKSKASLCILVILEAGQQDNPEKVKFGG